MDSQQVEIIGRHWLIGELVRAGLEAAEPARDNSVDLLISLADYSWTQPVQVKTHRGRVINVHPKYVRDGRLGHLPLLMAYTLRCPPSAEKPTPTRTAWPLIASAGFHS